MANINGLIRYFNLQDWWITTFTDQERSRLIETYGKKLTNGNITGTSLTPQKMMHNMCAFWKPTEADLVIVEKIKNNM